MSPPSRDDVPTSGSDARSFDERTLVDPSSDGEDSYRHGRPSSEVSEGGHDILESEDERERLLIQKDGYFGKKSVKIGSRRNKPDSPKKNQRKQGKNADSEEERELMYEMEEGVGASNSSIDRHSEESDERRLLATTEQRKARLADTFNGVESNKVSQARRARIWRRLAIYGSIAVFFIILVTAVYRVSTPKPEINAASMISNGTSLFAPTTIVISLDGFRADFLYRGITPTLNNFIQNGVSPKYMLPSFPSVTFPNHYTMVTGLYPEAHGVVGNSFWDPKLEKEFYYTDPDRSLQEYWWGGEPLWVTAERQNVRAAVHMWPGSEAPSASNIEPAYVDKYNGSELLSLKVDRILGLLDLPGPLDVGVRSNEPRPQLIAAYVPNVDGDGHRYGPNSTEIRKTIESADAMIGHILDGLHERNLTNIVNVVVVSDHGMASTDVSRLIQLEDLIDPNELSHIDGWPLYGLRPKNPDDLDRLHKQVVEKAKNNPNIEVYLRDKDMPERYHFSNNDRIAPLWIVPKTGWAIVQKDEFDVAKGKENGEVYHPRGLHGYDFEHPLMRAIFVARGPAFPHEPNSRIEPFQNIELHNIICDSIGISPAPNNSTIRLPFKPVGLHDDPSSPPNETPVDPVSHTNTVHPTLATMTSFASLDPSAAGLGSSNPPPILSWDSSKGEYVPAPTKATSAPPAMSSAAAKGDEKEEEESWWEWMTHKADGVEEWVDDFLHKHVPGKSGNDAPA